ncbi:MAG: TetR/AcrR family transcriptional regulator [Clostridiales bacterium]|nr:TetR/AcrR family transcriptional regulator [Clostridiales bacterium]MDU3244234.1 TetR/AcrR family transcriptional regulator [Clostridiales bacterium]
MNKQPEVTAQTRQNLIDAFWEIYTEKRIEKITVKEITAKAGYNRGTYEYFTDVYHLLDEIENALIPTVDELPAYSTSTGDRLGVPLDSFLQLYEHHNKYYSVLLGAKGDPAFSAKLKNQIKASLTEHFKENIQDAQEFDYTLEYVLSAMVGIMSYWFSKEQEISKERLMSLIRNLSEQGIRAILPL